MKIDNFIEGSLREEQQYQNISEFEYDKIFSKIENEVVNNKDERIVNRVCQIKDRIIKYFHFQELIQVTAFILVLILVPLLCQNYIVNNEAKNNKNKESKAINKIDDNNRLTKINWVYNKIIVVDTPLYEKADITSKQIKKSTLGELIILEDCVTDNSGKAWFKVVFPLDSTDGNRGWIPEGCCENVIAMINSKEKNIDNGDIKKLTEGYLNCLQQERDRGKKILEYKISEVKMGSINGGDIMFSAKYDLKPYDSKISSVEGNEVNKDGWITNIRSVGTVIKVKDYYVLIRMENDMTIENLQDNYSGNQNSAKELLEKNGLIMETNSGAGGMIDLPINFSNLSGDKEALGLYLAYCEEISKAQGYKLSGFKGKALQLVGGSVVKKDDLYESYEFSILFFENKICGAWLEKHGSGTAGKRLQTLDGRSLDYIVKNKKQWIEEKGFKNSVSLEKMLDENMDNKQCLIYSLIGFGKK